MIETIIGGIVAAVAGGLILTQIKKWNNRRTEERDFSKKRRCEKLIVFLSSGGTCRDPMAKAITLQALKSKKLPYEVCVKGMALNALSAKHVSFAAKQAISNLYHADLLDNHSPELVDENTLNEADLILIMDRSLMNNNRSEHLLPNGKTYLFKEFFGDKGDIRDPWPDGKDKKTLDRYMVCAKEMKTLIENGVERILNAL